MAEKKLIQHEFDKFVSPVDGNTSFSAVRTASATSSAPATGQAVIASTGTAVQLPSNAILNGVLIYAKSTNTSFIILGGSSVTNIVDGTGNGHLLDPGATTSAAVSNTDALYINGTAGDIVSFIGT